MPESCFFVECLLGKKSYKLCGGFSKKALIISYVRTHFTNNVFEDFFL